MKEFRKTIAYVTATLLMTAFAVNFNACSEQSPVQPDSASDFYRTALAKQATSTAIIVEKEVHGGGTKLVIKDKNLNGAEFDIGAGNVDEPILMRLVKLSKTSNVYHLQPFDLPMPKGVKVELEYNHSALPFGVFEDDLQVFHLAGDEYVPLKSRVQKNKKLVITRVYETGEYTLGAYDVDGNFHLIEGEYGLRQEDWINPKKGGTIRLGGGSYLEIPGGALDERTLIGMIATRETILNKTDAKAFTFTPHGTVFNKPIKLVLSWKEMEGEPVELYYYNELTNEWELSAEGTWDEKEVTVTLLLNHFSRYAVSWGR